MGLRRAAGPTDRPTDHPKARRWINGQSAFASRKADVGAAFRNYSEISRASHDNYQSAKCQIEALLPLTLLSFKRACEVNVSKLAF